MTDDRGDATGWRSADLVAEAGLGVAPEPPSVRMGSGTAWAVLAQGTATITSLVLGIMVSRTLGPQGKGELALIQQAIATLLVIGDLGISISAVYFVSKGEIRAGTVLGNCLIAMLAVNSVALVAVIALFRSQFAVVHIGWGLTAIAYGLFVVSIALAWLSAIAVGLKGVKGQAIPGVVSRVVTVGVVATVWIAGSRSVGLVIAASVIGSAVGVVLAYRDIRNALRPVRLSMAAFRQMASYSARLYAGSAADFLHFRQDVLLLGWMAGVSAVGVYSVGVSLGEIATRLPTALGSAIQAQLSRVSHESALDIAARITRLCAAFAVVAVLVLALVVPWAVPLVFGKGFSGAVTVFYLLIPGIIANALIWPISTYQSARGIVYWRESTASVVLNVAANLLLIPRWSYLGATLASSISYSFLFGLLLWRLCGDTGMGPWSFLVMNTEDVRVVVRSARSYLHR